MYGLSENLVYQSEHDLGSEPFPRALAVDQRRDAGTERLAAVESLADVGAAIVHRYLVKT